MHVQIVMDRQGDTRHTFNPANAMEISRAEQRFRELTGSGFTAVALGKAGAPGRQLRRFDETVTETLFITRLQGG